MLIRRKHEYESFLCGLLLKGLDIRSFVFAVRSFNVEIALIRDQVSQKDIGVGRLSFWRNAINKIFQHKSSKQDSTVDVPRHPVVLELRRVRLQYYFGCGCEEQQRQSQIIIIIIC